MNVPAALLLTGLLLAGCSDAAERLDEPNYNDTRTEESVERAPDRGRQIEVDPTAFQSLADFLVRAPGVFVDERGGSARVFIRGRPPLFVLDGIPIGFSYAEANNLVLPQQVDRIEVMNGLEAQALYGGRGSNGAIVIHTMRPLRD